MSNSSSQQVAGIPVTSTSSGIEIEFTNESSKTASVVNFAVDSNDQHFVIRDAGTFSPGISIKHRFRNGSGQAFVLPAFIAPNIKCRVASVRFTDGTVWGKGAQTAASVPRATLGNAGPLSVSPARLALDSNADNELFLVSSTERVAALKETDNCGGVAAINVAATGESSATYTVRPLAAGSCMATVTDEGGHAIIVPISIAAR